MSSWYYRGTPRYYHKWSARYFRPSTVVIFYYRLVERYYHFGAVLPPKRYYRDDVRYYRAIIKVRG